MKTILVSASHKYSISMPSLPKIPSNEPDNAMLVAFNNLHIITHWLELAWETLSDFKDSDEGFEKVYDHYKKRIKDLYAQIKYYVSEPFIGPEELGKIEQTAKNIINTAIRRLAGFGAVFEKNYRENPMNEGLKEWIAESYKRHGIYPTPNGNFSSDSIIRKHTIPDSGEYKNFSWVLSDDPNIFNFNDNKGKTIHVARENAQDWYNTYVP